MDYTDVILRGYATMASTDHARAYEVIVPDTLYTPVRDLFPAAPCRVMDLGAGTGRDAAWLDAQGHRVVAVEPVPELRDVAMRLHSSPQIDWRDDRLPELATIVGAFDFVLASGVWQHLDRPQRGAAMRRIAELLAPAGRLILSLRHGPGAPERPVFNLSAEEVAADATAANLTAIRRCDAKSIQPQNLAAGVSWTWLVLDTA